MPLLHDFAAFYKNGTELIRDVRNNMIKYDGIGLFRWFRATLLGWVGSKADRWENTFNLVGKCTACTGSVVKTWNQSHLIEIAKNFDLESIHDAIIRHNHFLNFHLSQIVFNWIHLASDASIALQEDSILFDFYIYFLLSFSWFFS